MGESIHQIIVIDLQAFIEGNSKERLSIAKQVEVPCQTLGFFYIKDAPISPVLVNQMFVETKRFFAQPLVQKNQISWESESCNFGYVGYKRERLNESQLGDLKEALNITPAQKDVSRNLASATTDLFQNTVLTFDRACAEIALVICQLLALALKLPENFFIEPHNEQNNTLRLLHYPPLKTLPQPGQLRAGEHSDYGSFTLLFSDGIEGLEIQNLVGDWMSVPQQTDAILVNIGDLMERWTNKKFRSTRHRVTIPSEPFLQQSRYSIAYFCHPNDDILIDCIDSCSSEENPPQYPPILAAAYLIERLQATY